MVLIPSGSTNDTEKTCLMQAGTIDASNMRLKAAAASDAMSEHARRQKYQQYSHMLKHELQEVAMAIGVQGWRHCDRDLLLDILVRKDSLLTANQDLLRRARQAADEYINGPVNLPVMGSTLEQKSLHYDRFAVHELRDLCRRHGLDAGFTFKHQLIRTLIASDAFLRAHGDADAAFAAQPDFPALEATHEEKAHFWDLLTLPQLSAICRRQGIWIHPTSRVKPVGDLIMHNSFMPAAAALSHGRRSRLDAAAYQAESQPLPSSSRSESIRPGLQAAFLISEPKS